MATKAPGTHAQAMFSHLTYDDVKGVLLEYWPYKPQPRINPYRGGEESPGAISYAWFGKHIDCPPYKFNRKTLQPFSFPELLSDIAATLGIPHDSALANLCHADGPPPSLGAHLDDEKSFDAEVDVVSVSFCKNPDYKRRFFVNTEPGKHATMATAVNIPLGHGDVYAGPLGTHLHGLRPPLVKDGKDIESIVITFRMLLKK
jgi:alkylated DNA repair dioxygenase AlkB